MFQLGPYILSYWVKVTNALLYLPPDGLFVILAYCPAAFFAVRANIGTSQATQVMSRTNFPYNPNSLNGERLNVCFERKR